MVLQPVDDRLPCVVLPESAEHLAGPVDRVDAAPGTGRVRALSAHGHVDAQRALAAGLDDRVARLHQDREVGLDQVGSLGRDPAQPVVDVVDLLALVEDEGHVAVGLRHRVRQPQRDGDPALHVAGAQAVQLVAVVAHGEVPVEGHGVDVAGDHHPLVTTEVGAGHQRVADAGHLEVVDRGESHLDGVGESLLVAAHRLDVDDRLGEGDHVCVEVQEHAGHLVTRAHARRVVRVRSVRAHRRAAARRPLSSAFSACGLSPITARQTSITSVSYGASSV